MQPRRTIDRRPTTPAVALALLALTCPLAGCVNNGWRGEALEVTVLHLEPVAIQNTNRSPRTGAGLAAVPDDE